VLAAPISASPTAVVSSLTNVYGQMFFAADDGVYGQELWTSDGTPAGTLLFADINPGPGSSQPGAFTVWNNRLFFPADDGVHGFELWALTLFPLDRAVYAPLVGR
jgi:ELWxxDGT repeat protein